MLKLASGGGGMNVRVVTEYLSLECTPRTTKLQRVESPAIGCMCPREVKFAP